MKEVIILILPVVVGLVLGLLFEFGSDREDAERADENALDKDVGSKIDSAGKGGISLPVAVMMLIYSGLPYFLIVGLALFSAVGVVPSGSGDYMVAAFVGAMTMGGLFGFSGGLSIRLAVGRRGRR